MPKRRLVGLSIFASALFAQACLVEACGGDDVMSSPDQPDEDAGAADHSVHDGSLADSTVPGDATVSDSSTGNDSSTIDDAASDSATTDAALDAGEDASIDAGLDGGSEDAGTDSGSTADSGIDAGPDSGVDAGARYSHTITIDGVNDFTADETFATTSSGYTGYLAWDSTYLYVGLQGTDVASGSNTKWILVYLGGSVGTTTGLQYTTQQPGLPFSAQYHVRWKADNTYTNAQAWSGTAWTDASWDFSNNVFQKNDYFEMRVPLVNIGSPTSVAVHVDMINEASGVEGTYSGVPSTSFTDGYDPDYAKYLELGLQGTTVPNASPVLP